MIALISHANKVRLKILQARLEQYMNQEPPDIQTEFRKGRGTRDQMVNVRWIIDKAREFQKNIYFRFIDYEKAFDYVDHRKLWKILKEMGISDHLPVSCEICIQVTKQWSEPYMEHLSGSELEKEHDKKRKKKRSMTKLPCHPVYTTYM